jgi:hypothetical protein
MCVPDAFQKFGVVKRVADFIQLAQKNIGAELIDKDLELVKRIKTFFFG